MTEVRAIKELDRQLAARRTGYNYSRASKDPLADHFQAEIDRLRREVAATGPGFDLAAWQAVNDLIDGERRKLVYEIKNGAGSDDLRPFMDSIRFLREVQAELCGEPDCEPAERTDYETDV